MTLLYILLLGVLMSAAASFAPHAGLGASPGGTILGGGYLLLTALLAGSVFQRLGLPKLTGYVVTGLVVGPPIMSLVSPRMLEDLRIFNGVATALIALEAGLELGFADVKPLLKTIQWISLLGAGLTAGLLTVALFLLQPMLPFASGLAAGQMLALAAMLGIALTAQSPAVAVAIRKEVEADGPLSQIILSCVVVGELVIVIGFTLSAAIAQALLGAQATVAGTLKTILWEVPGSLIIGVAIGVVMAPFLKIMKQEGAMFITAVGFLVAEVGRRVHLDVLLVALAVGLYIRNRTPYGHRLHEDVSAASLPIFVTFFSVAGAGVNLDALQVLMIPVLVVFGVRALGLYGGGWLSAKAAGATDTVARYVGLGLLPQGGLTLSLAVLLGSQFLQLGDAVPALVIGVFTLNIVLTPAFSKYALIRSGEAYRKPDSDAQALGRTPDAAALEPGV